MFNVEYSWQNISQEGEFGLRSRDYDELQQAYDFAARVIAHAMKHNENNLFPDDNYEVNLRITKVEYDRYNVPVWQYTLLTLMYDKTSEHAMWYSQTTGQIICC